MSLDSLIKQINKEYGENTAQVLTQDYVRDIKVFSSGSLALDLALGRGGIPRGRIVEFYGPESAGKTTLALLHMAEVQKADEGAVAFIDAEHTFDPVLAASYGVQLDKLVYIDPKTAENAIDTTDALIRTGEVRLIVIDSVPSLTPSKVAESSIEQQTMALLARFMSTTLQKITGPAYQHDCTVLFINQLRDKVGAHSPIPGHVPQITPGGRSLPFYASVRLNIKRTDRLTEGNEPIGQRMKVQVIKNKVGVPHKEATFDLYYNEGVDRIDEISQIAIYAKIIKQGGAWFSLVDENGEVVERDGVVYKWQGRSKFVDALREDAWLLNYLERKIRNEDIEAKTAEEIIPEDGY